MLAGAGGSEAACPPTELLELASGTLGILLPSAGQRVLEGRGWVGGTLDSEGIQS